MVWFCHRNWLSAFFEFYCNLGVIVKEGSICMDPVKVQGASEWPTPVNLKQVQQFLGFCNFYRRFVEGFSKIAGPLHGLSKKDHAFEWKTEHQEAFDTLKRAPNINMQAVRFCHKNEMEIHQQNW